MKTRKLRLLSALLALAMLFALTPTAAFADGDSTYEYTYHCDKDDTDHSITFKYTTDGNDATITGFEGSLPTDGVVEIPGKVGAGNDEYTVTAIGSQAFAQNTTLTKVTIPASVTKIEGGIGIGAFQNCANLKTVVLAENSQLQNIEYGAFYYCTALKSINLGAATQLKSIGIYAFVGAALTELTLPASVTTIGNGAFTTTNSGQGGALKSVTLQDGSQLQSIGERAFQNCASLERFDFAKVTQLKNIGEQAFYNCKKLKTLDLSNATQLNTIEKDAFSNCTKLENVSLPENSSLEKIESYAFSSTALKNVTIPTTITEIGRGAFASCGSLTSITFTPTSRLKTIQVYAFLQGLV